MAHLDSRDERGVTSEILRPSRLSDPRTTELALLPSQTAQFVFQVSAGSVVALGGIDNTVDVPARFRRSKSVGAVFGLTPSRDQSGETDRPGAISRCGDAMMRTTLYEAAQSMLVHSTRWSWLKAWAMKIARHRGMKRAIVALARRLAVVMHRIWVDGTEFRWTREAAVA
jgi:transposase